MAHQHENRSKSTSPLETTVHLTNIITLQEIEIDRLTKENEQHKLSLDEKSAQIADLEKKLYDIRIAIDDQENKDPTQSVSAMSSLYPKIGSILLLFKNFLLHMLLYTRITLWQLCYFLYFFTFIDQLDIFM